MDARILSIFGGMKKPQAQLGDAPGGGQQVRAYWQALRDGDGVPLRDRIDPRGIAGALERVFMIERIAPGLARFRIAGSEINDVFGTDARGMPVTALFDPIARNRMAPVLEQVFASPAVLHLSLEAERGIGRPALQARMLLLPLASEPGRIDLALGCLDLCAPIGRVPRRFAIGQATVEVLSETAAMPAERPAERLQAFAEAQADYVPPRASGAQSHLRLVDSADY